MGTNLNKQINKQPNMGAEKFKYIESIIKSTKYKNLILLDKVDVRVRM